MPRRRRSTWGTIERLGRDHWRLRWWEEREGVYARHSECVWGTRREAERRLAEIRASLDETRRGARRAVRRMTVGEVWERYERCPTSRSATIAETSRRTPTRT